VLLIVALLFHPCVHAVQFGIDLNLDGPETMREGVASDDDASHNGDDEDGAASAKKKKPRAKAAAAGGRGKAAAAAKGGAAAKKPAARRGKKAKEESEPEEEEMSDIDDEDGPSNHHSQLFGSCRPISGVWWLCSMLTLCSFALSCLIRHLFRLGWWPCFQGQEARRSSQQEGD